VLLVGLAAATAGCSIGTQTADELKVAPTVDVITLTDRGDIENLLQITDRIYSGGEPTTVVSMERLRSLGIRTLISVDGASPNVELAADYGMRYVHIPLGYDGIAPEAAGALTKAIHDLEGPIFVHCHHGKHRGPAAAAVCAIAETGIHASDAIQILEHAGTSRDYPGLWRDVESFLPPDNTDELPDLVSIASVDSFVMAMASIGRASDHLGLLAANGWETPTDHPDLIASQEALILYEGFRESLRFLEQTNPYDPTMLESMQLALELAERLQVRLDAGDIELANQLYAGVKDSCKSCHSAHRN
jgi:protein tyrosine phosphatase (PTP) superfamily phosphohydrolase (DUF442 family)